LPKSSTSREQWCQNTDRVARPSSKAKGDQAFAFAGQNSNTAANSVTWFESGIKIQKALEQAGIHFTEDDTGEIGVRLKMRTR
jgi:hypothetical protein